MKTCQTCGGSGREGASGLCPICAGSGGYSHDPAEALSEGVPYVPRPAHGDEHDDSAFEAPLVESGRAA